MVFRKEYPRPQFVRDTWTNLNGEWEFYNDFSASGMDREIWKNECFDGKINVPFCPESDLSGVGYKDFMCSVWYAKNIEVSNEQLRGKVLLHFGACDYLTTVFVNGIKVGTHKGGYTSFTFDITEYLSAGQNRIVVNAYDDIRTLKQPSGKQCLRSYSFACRYTRTTGIWQTVWLEYVPETYIKKVKVTATNLDGRVALDVTVNRYVEGAVFKASATFDGKPAGAAECRINGTTASLELAVSEVHPWNVGEPNLYDIEYTLEAGECTDTVKSYFGIRRIDIDGYAVRINGKSVFQRLILDQGFYPDGICTAPSDEALVRDIEYSMNAGFNGARLHQKVFEERFLYHADRMGYLVWGEYPNWGVDSADMDLLHTYLPEWLESVERDYNHPSIIGWCPYNETWTKGRQVHTNVSMIVLATKYADPTRPVIDVSGGYHAGITDIYDEHDYDQDSAVWEERMKAHAAGKFFNKYPDKQVKYDGKIPYMISEYGGIKWTPDMLSNEPFDRRKAWGYGNAPKSVEELCERFCRQTAAIMNTPNVMGLCYTQLTDIEQEQNGLYYYDRTKKWDDEVYTKFREVLSKKAAIED